MWGLKPGGSNCNLTTSAFSYFFLVLLFYITTENDSFVLPIIHFGSVATTTADIFFSSKEHVTQGQVKGLRGPHKRECPTNFFLTNKFILF